MEKNDYLDAAKAALGIQSDYELARRFEVSKQAICEVRKDRAPLTPYLAARVSDVTGTPLEKIIEDIEANDKNEARARYWKERAARKAAGFFIGVLSAGILALTPTDDAHATKTSDMTQQPGTLIGAGFNDENNHLLHIMRFMGGQIFLGRDRKSAMAARFPCASPK